MNINLRKANAVQHRIQEAVKNLDFSANVDVNEFEDHNEQIRAVHDRFTQNRYTRDAFVRALFEIRKAVSRANAENGINDKLAEVARLEKEIQFYNTFATLQPRLSNAVVEGKIAKIKQAKEDRLFGSDRVSTSVFTQTEIDEFKRTVAGFRREKQKLQDELLELNVRTEISLNKDTADFLEKVEIL